VAAPRGCAISIAAADVILIATVRDLGYATRDQCEEMPLHAAVQ
jgi:hypothetical protein